MVEGPRGILSARAEWRVISCLVLLAVLLVFSPANRADGNTRQANAREHLEKPYLVLVSIDGFRWDYQQLADTPAIDRIAARGLKAEALQPVFPTLTFPNHFSIATGLLPEHHGLVANEFPGDGNGEWYVYKDRESVQDGTWYLADPVWVTAEKRGMRSAAYYFVGTEADIGGSWPTDWREFDPDISGQARVSQVLEWLSLPAETRPHLLTLYFEDVDDETHSHGVSSKESIAAIEQVDANLGQLLDGIESLPHAQEVYLFLVSDHGMAGFDSSRPVFVIDEHVGLEGIRAVEGGPYVFLHFEETPDDARVRRIRDSINEHWDCGKALLSRDAPAAWHVGESGRWPDLIVLAEPRCAVISSAGKRHKVTSGDHGWAPDDSAMRGIFYAMGPRIPPGTEIGIVNATDVYPMMMNILGLAPPHAIDGNPDWFLSLLLPDSDVR